MKIYYLITVRIFRSRLTFKHVSKANVKSDKYKSFCLDIYNDDNDIY